jgi:periplasmic protein TonB
MEAQIENKNRWLALAFAIVFHALLFLLMFYIVFVTPIPPFEIKEVPEIEIGLGMEGLGTKEAGGSGQNDKDIATTATFEKIKTTQEQSANNIITDDSEETATVITNKNNKKETKQESEVVKEEKASSELLNALAILKNKNKHNGKGEGDGNKGGSGNGSKQGVGDGNGTGIGNGEPGYNGKGGYDLKGRNLLRKPERMSDSEEEGIVVVEIIVDETGRVIKATPGQRGSTTTSANLYAKARQAAFSAKFNASPEGITEQRGTYTFVFSLE